MSIQLDQAEILSLLGLKGQMKIVIGLFIAVVALFLMSMNVSGKNSERIAASAALDAERHNNLKIANDKQDSNFSTLANEFKIMRTAYEQRLGKLEKGQHIMKGQNNKMTELLTSIDKKL